MNKALLLTLGLSLTLLVSCSTETDAPSPDVETPPTTSVPSTENTPEVEVETPDLPLEENDDTVAGTSPELLSNEQSLFYADAIFESRDAEANEYMPLITSPDDPMNEFLFPMLGFTPDDTEAFAVSVSAMMVQAYGVAVIKPVEGKEELVKAGLQGFIDNQVQNFTNYLADQLDVAEAARLETLDDGTIIMVVCAGQDEVFDGIVSYLGSQ